MQRRMDDDIADDDGFAIEPESSEDELQRPAKNPKDCDHSRKAHIVPDCRVLWWPLANTLGSR